MGQDYSYTQPSSSDEFDNTSLLLAEAAMYADEADSTMGITIVDALRFDVRAEKIEIFKTPKKPHLSIAYNSALINYNGKLGRLVGSCTNNLVTLWVLEDVEKREWSSMTHALPYQCGSIHRVFVVCEFGMHAGSNMMFRPLFRVCYYDFNKRNRKKVEIRGMEDGDLRGIHGFGVLTGYTCHIENIRFL
ncbi:hypothetical protein Bca4012_048839 [Brassica carinata]|uniref:(rape) hypothetical protein n=1 Tax=Brassica napus TaxID=3708 RepID=A0A816JYX8_BRANA|nr:unnamed protein product [Brassica napus]